MHRKILLAAASAALAAGCAPDANDRDLYYGFTRIDPESRTLTPDSFIVVEGGSILEVGAGERPDGPFGAVHDLSGTYALPGFVDAHGHITAGPHAVEASDAGPVVTMESVDEVTRFHARMALAFGVTSIRNPGADPQASADYDRRIASGEWIGPDAVHAGAVIQPPPFGGNAFAYPQSRDDWFAEAERQAALGMRYFKLYHGLTEDELALGIEAAHAHGLEAIAHLDQVSWLTAAELGIDGLLHALPTSADLLEPEAAEAYRAARGQDSRFMYQWFEHVDFDGPRVQRLIDVLAERQIEVDLTLLVNELVYSENGHDAVMQDGDARYFHPDALAAAEQFTELARMGWTDEDYARADTAMDNVHEFVRRLHAAGVPLLIGTDSAGGGPSYAKELQLHHEAGLDRWEVLRLATSASAEGIGLEHTGRLRAGHEADIVFLDANPVEDLAHARNVHTVVSNGRAYSFEELTAEGPQTAEREE